VLKTCLVSHIFLFAAGCSYFNKNTTAAADPFLGGPPVSAPSKTGNQQSAMPVTALPPLPAPNSSASPAVLATGPLRTWDNSRDLRIGNPQANAGNDGWVGRNPNLPKSGTGAALVGIQPPAEVASRNESQPPYSPVSLPSSQVTTVEQAQAILKSRGAIFQQFAQDRDSGKVRFSCILPDRQNPDRHHVYEYTAADSLSAIRAALNAVDQGQ
jgi:hypothetical protein